MRRPAAPLLFALAATFLGAPRALPQEPGPEPEPQYQPPPEEEEDLATWINLIGEPPTPQNLRGRCIVLLFFSQEDVTKRVNWGQIKYFHHAFEGRVTMLGIFSGSASQAEELAELHNMFFPIGVGTDFRKEYSVTEPAYQILIDKDGAVYWHGPLGGLWQGKLLKGMRGSQQVHEEGPLLLHVEPTFEGRAGRIRERMAEGELGRAYKEIEALLVGERTSEEEREAAQVLKQRIERHLARVREQIEQYVARGEALRAEAALKAVARDLRALAIGAPFAQRLEELEGDAAFQRELEADQAFETLYAAYWKRGPSKSQAKIARLIDNYGGTRGARKARNLSTGN